MQNVSNKQDEFVVVNKKRKKGRRRQNADKISSYDIEIDKVDHSLIKAKLNHCVLNLRGSTFYKCLLESTQQYSSLIKCRHKDVDTATNCDYEDSVQQTLNDSTSELDQLTLRDATTGLDHLTLNDKTSDLNQLRLKDANPDVDFHFVCYGVGHIASCNIAQYQLALCMALRDDFKLRSDQCFMYDPVFSNDEETLIQNIGFTLVSSNEEGKRRCSVPTLFFLPHCGKPLYNNLLWSNWCPERLSNVILIGNSFASMVERTPGRFLKKTGSYILKILKFTEETELKTFQPNDIFNDMSIHRFTPESLAGVPKHFWDSSHEPVYENEPEIILNG